MGVCIRRGRLVGQGGESESRGEAPPKFSNSII